MNKSELIVKQKWEKNGWKMLRGGAPDFFALKIENGYIKEVRGVEVKYGNDKLRYEQEIVRRAFKFLSIPYIVEHIRSTRNIPKQANPLQTSPLQSSPVQPIPCQTNPAQANPNRTRPDQSNPVQATPLHTIPRPSNTVRTNPTQTVPHQTKK